MPLYAGKQRLRVNINGEPYKIMTDNIDSQPAQTTDNVDDVSDTTEDDE